MRYPGAEPFFFLDRVVCFMLCYKTIVRKCISRLLLD